MNPWLVVLLVLAGLFLVLYVVAMIKRPGSRYKDKPEEQNPMEGKYVRFVADENEKENADGVRGHLEAVGPSNHPSAVLLFSLLCLPSSVFGFLSMIRARYCLSRSGLVKTSSISHYTNSGP